MVCAGTASYLPSLIQIQNHLIVRNQTRQQKARNKIKYPKYITSTYIYIYIYILKQSHTKLVLTVYTRLHISAVSYHQIIYKLLFRNNYTLQKKDRPYIIYNFSWIKVNRRPDYGLQLRAKHVAVNTLPKLLLCARPVSWSSGHSFWLLIVRSHGDFSLKGKIPMVTMIWVVS
jgi:hypothetical protein